MTKEERVQTEERLSELTSNNVTIDDEFISSISDGVLCKPIEVDLRDKDDDGVEEIWITSHIESVGARTPIQIYTNAVFEFELIDNGIQL
ncbi:hypothetical protein H8B09_23430 [Paenibacillus sp. PR3]|uniref:Uncharacterized protein n=1 Tax=Paenibacillus terricola TaxID=2763503 RepID=A0ABR8N4H0_9BACL|nr:hypothetical protein [Paenibacillus terricola]MBD3921734.1 hypothetical protein [Paenibacillus terricola]